jgi:hypothetical protein
MRATPPPTNGVETPAAPRTVDLVAKQRAIVEQIQKDEGYLATLRSEIAAVEARLAGNRGKLDLIAELSADAGGA